MQEKPLIVTQSEIPGVATEAMVTTNTRLSGWRRWSGHGIRVTFWLTVLATLLFVAAVAVTRFWLIPNADSFRPRLVQELSRLSGQRVVIGGFDAGWDGWSPELKLTRLQMLDPAGRVLLQLPEVNTTISWRSLIFLEPRLTALTVRAPRVVVRRTAENALTIAGIDLDLSSQIEGDSALPEWLLRQRLVQIVGGEIEWVDDWRKLPPLRLKNVNIRMQNSGDTHRVGMTAVPPAELAAPLDIRAELVGSDVRKVSNWDGLAYVRTDYANLGALTRYLPLPIALTRGEGGLQAWFEFDDGQVISATTDLVVKNAQLRFPTIATPSKAVVLEAAGTSATKTSLRHEPLDLASLTGRLSWRSKPSAGLLPDPERTQERWSLRDVNAITPGGVKAPLVNGEVLVDYHADTMLGGELRLSEVALGGATALAKSLPINPDLAQRLLTMQPTGTVKNINLKWRDLGVTLATTAAARLERYLVEGSADFNALSWKEHDGVPGVNGLTGTLKGSSREGAFTIGEPVRKGKPEPKNIAVAVDFGAHFGAPISFDALRGKFVWKRELGADGKASTVINVSSAEFANTDVAGQLHGSWRSDALGAGVADINGTLSRADVRALHRYLPTTFNAATRSWLREAIVAGTAEAVDFQLKGPLWHFPFHNGEQGVFALNAQLSGVILDYADHWDRAENISAKLSLRGARIDAQVASASIAGVPIAATTVRIADTLAQPPILEISGSSSATMDALLHWAGNSQVNVWLDGFLQSAKATGPGRLNLTLKMPLDAPERTIVVGELVFAGNRVDLGGEIPALENVVGSLRFSERDVRGTDISAEALGGPMKFTIATVDGRIKTEASGSATFERVRERFSYPLLDQLSGSIQWQLEMSNPARSTATASSVVVAAATNVVTKPDSGLLITATTVQPRWPLDSMFQVGAAARDGNAPIKATIARSQLDRGRDRIEFVVPGQMHAILERSAADAAGARTVERATIDLGAQKTALATRGYSLRGDVTKLDADAAMALLSPATLSGKRAVGGLTSDTGSADFVNINLRAIEAVVFGQRFNDVVLLAQPTGQRWRLALRSKEATGQISLDTDAKSGAVDAVLVRLQRFSLPSSAPVTGAQTTGTDESVRWPKLDLTADSFVSEGRDLGKLEMRAQPGVDEWRIEQVKLSSADGSIEAQGRWQPRFAGAMLGKTSVDVSLKWGDAAKFMARFGLPKGVERAAGTLTGALSWAGSPAQFSYAKLAGNFSLETTQGRFTEMEPGIAKLLGVLSLQSLPRRLSFNFDDLFGKGFAFDEVKAVVMIADGVAKTDGFEISGPSARVQIRGTADLNDETQDLRVRVFPSLSTATAIGIGLATANPAIGAAVLLGQKLAKDPIERFLMQEFDVRGSWAKPDVKPQARTGVGSAASANAPATQ